MRWTGNESSGLGFETLLEFLLVEALRILWMLLKLIISPLRLFLHIFEEIEAAVDNFHFSFVD